MHMIETTAVVTADHQLVVHSPVPEDILPGEHAVVVTLDPARQAGVNGSPLFRPPYPIGLSDDRYTFRREEM